MQSRPSADTNDKDYVLDDQVGHLLRRAHQRHTSIFQEHIGDSQLTPLQFAALVKLSDLGEVSLLGFPTRMSGSEVPIQAAPLLGEHNDEVLREDLELSDDEIAALRRDGILAREP